MTPPDPGPLAGPSLVQDVDRGPSPALDLVEAPDHPQARDDGLVAPGPFAHPSPPVRFPRSEDPAA